MSSTSEDPPAGGRPAGPRVPPRQDPHRRALSLAFDAAGRRSAEELARLGARPAGEGCWSVEMLELTVEVDLASREVTSGGAALVDSEQILLLHYLDSAAEESAGRQISFREIPSAGGYHGPYAGRVLGRLTRAFGVDGAGFEEACRAVGGVLEPMGDFGFRVMLLPRVPAWALYFRGDRELGPSARLLYDANVDRFLSVEDVVVGSELLARRLAGGSWLASPDG